MKEIPIGVNGRILSGKYKGWYIKVTPEGKGGHLILYKKGISDTSEGYDDWVPREDLEKYFKETQLEIEWFAK